MRGLEPSAGRLQRKAAGFAVIGLLGAIALVCLFATGWFAIYLDQGPVVASACCAAAAIVLALLVWMMVSINDRRNARLLEMERQRLALASASRAGGLFTAAEFPALVRASPVITMLSVAGIAYAFVRSRR